MYYILSGILGLCLVLSQYLHDSVIASDLRTTIFIALIALFAITMPSIGALCAKIIDLKRQFPNFGMSAIREVKVTLYEQTIPVLISPFLVILCPYLTNSDNHYLLFFSKSCDFLLYFFFFHSIFVVFDIFLSFVSIALSVSRRIDNMENDEIVE